MSLSRELAWPCLPHQQPRRPGAPPEKKRILGTGCSATSVPFPGYCNFHFRILGKSPPFRASERATLCGPLPYVCGCLIGRAEVPSAGVRSASLVGSSFERSTQGRPPRIRLSLARTPACRNAAARKVLKIISHLAQVSATMMAAGMGPGGMQPVLPNGMMMAMQAMRPSDHYPRQAGTRASGAMVDSPERARDSDEGTGKRMRARFLSRNSAKS